MANKRINFDAPRKRALNATNGDKLIDQSTFFQLYDVPLVSPPADGKRTMHKLEDFKVGQKVLFQAPERQILTAVIAIEPTGEIVLDAGFDHPTRKGEVMVDLANIGQLRILNMFEWLEYAIGNKDLARHLSREDFLELQGRVERLNRSDALGEEADEVIRKRILSITDAMDHSPWMMHPDKGCILKAQDLTTGLSSLEALTAFTPNTCIAHREAMLLSVPTAKKPEFNIFQKKALEVYNAGNHPVKTPDDVANCGDLLLRFILEELSDLNIDPEEFPTTAARAARDRLEAAIGQLTAVSSALWR